MRARRSASATSWSGASGTEDSATTVAQRRTARVPSSVSASRTVSILRGSAKNAELTWRRSASREPDVGADDPLEILERRLGRGQLRERLQRGDRALADAVAARSPRGRAKNSPWKCEKPSTRQRVNSSAVVDARGDEHEPARGRLGDQPPAAPRRCGR